MTYLQVGICVSECFINCLFGNEFSSINVFPNSSTTSCRDHMFWIINTQMDWPLIKYIELAVECNHLDNENN